MMTPSHPEIQAFMQSLNAEQANQLYELLTDIIDQLWRQHETALLRNILADEPITNPSNLSASLDDDIPW